MTAYGPKAHLGSARAHYKKAVSDGRQLAAPASAWWGVRRRRDRPGLDRRPTCPPSQGDKVDEVKAGLKGRQLRDLEGSHPDQSGKEVLAKDAVADDAFLGGISSTSRASKQSCRTDRRDRPPATAARAAIQAWAAFSASGARDRMAPMPASPGAGRAGKF